MGEAGILGRKRKKGPDIRSLTDSCMYICWWAFLAIRDICDLHGNLHGDSLMTYIVEIPTDTGTDTL